MLQMFDQNQVSNIPVISFPFILFIFAYLYFLIFKVNI